MKAAIANACPFFGTCAPPRHRSLTVPSWIVFLLVLVVPLTGVRAATLTVPGSSATIQGAIVLAATGDTVLVSPGIYAEAIDFLGKNITVKSTGGPAVTTITAPAMTPVVQFIGGETRSAILDGFTLTGGKPASVAPYYGDGGGIFVSGASPTITNNTIKGNVACAGGGIDNVGGSPLISRNTISGNRADCSQLGFSDGLWGGGISLRGASSGMVPAPVITDNLITGNTAVNGSAIGMFDAGTPSISGNTMNGNMATQGDCRFFGGTIWMVNVSDADIVQNIIVSNDAVCNGGVVIGVPNGSRGPALVNNTIALNAGSASSGIYADGFDGMTRMINNIVVAPPGATALYCSNLYATAPPIMQNNLFYSAGGVAASGFCAAQIGVNGNISADPQLAAPAMGDVRLLASSPAIDTGNSSEPLVPATDFGSAPRVQDGNGDGTAIVDMGAFEAPSLASATVTVSGGSGQSTRVGMAFPQPLVALVRGVGNSPLANATVTWTAPTSAASATFSQSTSTLTDSQGLATIAAGANAISGAYIVDAHVATSGAGFNLANTITIAAGNTCGGNAATNADLVEQYYAAILRRPSDAAGRTFWTSEADRICALGADPKQTFFLLSNVFFNTPEYVAFNRDDNAFVTDNYITFFGRLPDAGGLAYWTGQLAAGMPRNNVMSSFLFSPEFTATMNGVFPGRIARAETYLTLNLYGGFFRRLADSAGYTYWDGEFRTAQCSATPVSAVRAISDAVSSQFLGSAEYGARRTTNSQYVQDLYYAMLQRGGDLAGFNFWVGQLNGVQTLDQVRQQFLASPEIQAQSAAIAAQGCLP